VPASTQLSQVTADNIPTFDFWSIDMNAYLYREKVVMAEMAKLLGNTSGHAYWSADATVLLPRLRKMFYVPSTTPGVSGGGARGFFQDRYFNGEQLATCCRTVEEARLGRV
jgi:hypothetical protein